MAPCFAPSALFLLPFALPTLPASLKPVPWTELNSLCLKHLAWFLFSCPNAVHYGFEIRIRDNDRHFVGESDHEHRSRGGIVCRSVWRNRQFGWGMVIEQERGKRKSQGGIAGIY